MVGRDVMMINQALEAIEQLDSAPYLEQELDVALVEFRLSGHDYLLPLIDFFRSTKLRGEKITLPNRPRRTGKTTSLLALTRYYQKQQNVLMLTTTRESAWRHIKYDPAFVDPLQITHYTPQCLRGRGHYLDILFLDEYYYMDLPEVILPCLGPETQVFGLGTSF